MDHDTVIGTRIEILKIVHRNDLQPDQLIERAKALEGYVFSELTEVGGTPPAPSAGTPKKNRVR